MVGMRFAVLGTLQVLGPDGEPVRLGGTVRRQVLAALLCRANRPVPADVLIEDVWGELAPRSAAKTLQSHIVRLRDDLGREAEPELRTEAGGYLLDTAGLDAQRFEQLVTDLPDDPDVALGQLDEALGLWRGEAYADFADAPFAVGERLRLSELRSAAVDRRADLALDSGRAAELVAELELRTTVEPYRERGWEQLMLALYRSGRQVDALGAFRRVQDLLATDLGVDPGPDLRDLQQRILRQDEKLLLGRPVRSEPSVEAGTCPYRGLAGYSDADTALFVGRERLTAELAGRFTENPLVIVTGPSGSGKSSLLHAGLLPALRGGALPGSASWRTVVCTPSTLDAGSAGAADLLVVDQAEELFSVLDDVQRAQVVGAVSDRLAAGARAVLALRGDFFDRLPALGPLAALARSTVLVRPMRDDEIRRAVTEPATRCGYLVEPALVEALLDEVSGRPGVLPLMSVALVRAWRNRDDTVVTLAGYRAGGGVAGALEAGAEETWAALPNPVRPAARRLLVRLASAENGSWVRRPLPLSAIVDTDEQRALSVLTERRLVTVGGGRAEIVHEALLQRWSRLRTWLDDRALAVELLEHVATAARAWDAAGRTPADLYRGARLSAALEHAQAHPDDLAPLERAFLGDSETAAQSELAEARARADREARGRRRLGVLVGVLALVLAAAIGVGAVAVHERSTARASATRADSAALAADARRLAAEALAAPDLRTSLLLAVAGYRLQPSIDTRSALLTAVERGGSAEWRISTANRVQWLGADAANTTVWTSDNQAVITRYSVRTHRVVGRFPDHAARVAALSPDGRLLVVCGTDGSLPASVASGQVRVLDARTGAVVRVLPDWTLDGPPTLHPAAFTGNGRWLVVLQAGDRDGAHPARSVAVYDTSQLARAPRHFALSSPVSGIAAGRTSFAVSSTDHRLQVVDAASFRVLASSVRAELEGPASAQDGGDHLAEAADGSAVASLGAGGKLSLFRRSGATVRAVPVQLDAHDWQALGFDPSGARLAVGAADDSVVVLSATTGVPVQHLAGDDGSVMNLAWASATAPGGEPALYSGGLDSQVVSWDLTAAARMLAFAGPTRPVGEYGVVGPRLVGFEPIQPGDGGTGTLAGERLLVTDLATGRTRSWPLHLHGNDYLADDSRDAQARFALLTVADSGTRGRCELHELADGRVLDTLSLSYGRTAAGVCVLSRDGRAAVAATGQHVLTSYRLPDFTRTGTLTVTPRGPAAARVIDIPLGWTPHGDLVLWGADPGGGNTGSARVQLLMLAAPDGQLLGQATLGAGAAPESLRFSPDGTRLVVGDNSGRVTIFSSASLRRLAGGVVAADGEVLAAGFSPDGSMVVTTGTDGTMRLFDGTTLQSIGTAIHLPADDWAFGGFSGQGDQIAGLAAVALGRQRYFTFPGDPAQWARVACQIAGAQLSRAEWSRFVGDRPYSRVCSPS